MDKSINDIYTQADRIIANAKGTRFFKATDNKGGVDKTAVYKLAAVAKSQHGFSVFETNKDVKRPCVHTYVNRCNEILPEYLQPAFIESMKRVEERMREEVRERNERQKKQQSIPDPMNGMSHEQKCNYIERQLQLEVFEGLRLKVLQIIRTEMEMSKLMDNVDPYELPTILYNDMARILKRNRIYKQLSLF